MEEINVLASSLSALATAGALWVGIRVLRNDHRANAERLVEERRKYAGMVSAWGELVEVLDHSMPYPRQDLTYFVQNNSDSPVFEVAVYMPETYGEPRGNIAIGMVAPQSKANCLGGHGIGGEFLQPAPVPIFFSDVAGVRWVRDGRGTLYEWTEDIERRLSDESGVVGDAPRTTLPRRAPSPQLDS
ncbi:hypothetical protein [Streptomyces sp. NPDC026673]|uniref:hypothetical protein n=1 Tax=Streptomyces sp. NPDC026673 TaxID=3155724 RepID=UPI0033DDD2B8